MLARRRLAPRWLVTRRPLRRPPAPALARRSFVPLMLSRAPVVLPALRRTGPAAPALPRWPFQSLQVSRALVLLLALFGAGPAAAAPGPLEIRCGWLVNPTPANIWLRDRDREWIIALQGGYQLSGDWPWPAFAPGQWQELNGHYGRGCACVRGRVDRGSGRVVEIQDSWPRPLRACREDPALGPWSPP